jgi:hypothetical protein
VRALCLGAGLDWSSLLLRALNAVSTPYVLLTLEDFFLRRQIDTERLVALFMEFQRAELDMLRLAPRPGPSRSRTPGREFAMIPVTDPYRVSTQAAFWRAETLRQLLVPGESPWEFETNGTKRSAAHEGFAAVWREALPYGHHVVERGKWFPWAARRFQRMEIGVDLSARPAMTTAETARWVVAKVMNPVVQRMPRSVRRTLRPVVRRIGFLK